MRLALLAALALSGCVPDLDLDLDFTGPGQVYVQDDGVTLTASACFTKTDILGCDDSYTSTAAMTVDGATVPLVFGSALFAERPFSGEAPSPTNRVVQFAGNLVTGAGYSAGSFSLDAALLPEFDFQLFAPETRAQKAKLIVQRLPGATVTVNITSICGAQITTDSFPVTGDKMDVKLTGDGPCDHTLSVTQAVITGTDALSVTSARYADTTFSTLP